RPPAESCVCRGATKRNSPVATAPCGILCVSRRNETKLARGNGPLRNPVCVEAQRNETRPWQPPPAESCVCRGATKRNSLVATAPCGILCVSRRNETKLARGNRPLRNPVCVEAQRNETR